MWSVSEMARVFLQPCKFYQLLKTQVGCLAPKPSALTTPITGSFETIANRNSKIPFCKKKYGVGKSSLPHTQQDGAEAQGTEG